MMKRHNIALATTTVFALAAPLSSQAGEPITSGTDFNPAISVILDGVYYNALSGDAHDHGPAGFEGGHDHGHDHDHADGLDDGFNLRHTELALSGTLDPYFDANATLAIEGTSGVKLEEAYITTRALPAGLQVKAGRFFSGVGYINDQHEHEWLFVDRPLVNEHLFGDHGLQENGVQLTWMPATDNYLLFGLELLQGENESVAGYVGDQGHHENDSDDEIDYSLTDRPGPRLLTGFLKFGPDLGFDHAAQFGLSYGLAPHWQRAVEHGSGLEEWDGSAWFAGLDAVYKYDAGRDHGHGNLVVQAEYLYREVDVDYQRRQFDPTDASNAEGSGVSKQDGLYLQAAYGFAPRWDAGLRWEALGLTNEALVERDGGATTVPDHDTSYRTSLQVRYMPSEFSYLRAQFNQLDYAEDDGERESGWEFMLQYNVSLGAHGAHSF